MLSCIDTVFTGMLGGERPGISTVNVLGLPVASKYASADMQRSLVLCLEAVKGWLTNQFLVCVQLQLIIRLDNLTRRRKLCLRAQSCVLTSRPLSASAIDLFTGRRPRRLTWRCKEARS